MYGFFKKYLCTSIDTNWAHLVPLNIYNVYNPRVPILVSSTANIGSIFAVQGSYAYVSTGNGYAYDPELETYDISNPAAPTLINAVSVDNATDAYVQGRYLYMTDRHGDTPGLYVFDLGGAYIQQLEVGGLEAGTLSLRNNLSALDGSFQGGLTVGNNLNVAGSFGLTASSFNATTTVGKKYSIFSINTASSTNPLFTTLYNGNVGVGTTTPYSRLEVWGPDSVASTSAFAVVNSASTTVFAVYDNGNSTYSGSIFQSSDQRLKTNITALDASSSLAAIGFLNPVSYTRTDQDNGENLGFIAQQVASVFPELVSTTSATTLTPGGTLTLNYVGLIAPMVKAIQAIISVSGEFQANLAAWLGNASNGIQKLFANEVDAGKLCAKNSDGSYTCITGDQLAAILNGSSQPAVHISGSNMLTINGSTSIPPTIVMNGNNPAVLFVGDTYTDLGAIVTDNQGHSLSYKTFVNGVLKSPVVIDTTQAATDTIDYVATDAWGNTATSSRAVSIEATSTQIAQ